jgi:hypothetical protein
MKDIVVVTANSGFDDFLMNWLCYSSKVGIQNVVVFSLDQPTTSKLIQAGINVYMPEEANLFVKILQEDQTYGSVEYQILVLLRTYFINECVTRGYSVLIADIDAVWLSNPFKKFHDYLAGYEHRVVEVMAPRDTPNDAT